MEQLQLIPLKLVHKLDCFTERRTNLLTMPRGCVGLGPPRSRISTLPVPLSTARREQGRLFPRPPPKNSSSLRDIEDAPRGPAASNTRCPIRQVGSTSKGQISPICQRWQVMDLCQTRFPRYEGQHEKRKSRAAQPGRLTRYCNLTATGTMLSIRIVELTKDLTLLLHVQLISHQGADPPL